MSSGIYKISNRITGRFYIGSAAILAAREKQHFSALRRNVHHNRYLQASFIKHGRDAFSFEILELCVKGVLLSREQYWINVTDATRLGYNLAKNVTAPMTGVQHTAEACAKMSRSHIGREKSRQHKDAIGNALRGRKQNEEHRQKNKLSHMGQTPSTLSDAGRARISATHRGKIVSAETREKQSAARKTRITSEESKEKARLSMLAYWDRKRQEG